MADLLVGYLQQFDANTQAIVEQLQKAYAGYVQDDWKVSRTLTLNLGLRYEYTTPYYGAGPNRNINFDFKTGQLVTAKNPYGLPGESRPHATSDPASAMPGRSNRRSWCCAAVTASFIRARTSPVRMSTCR